MTNCKVNNNKNNFSPLYEIGKAFEMQTHYIIYPNSGSQPVNLALSVSVQTLSKKPVLGFPIMWLNIIVYESNAVYEIILLSMPYSKTKKK